MEELAISGFGAWAELPPGMWNLPGPGPGIEPMSPALAGGFLTTGSPGKFYSSFCLQAYGIQSRCCFPVHLSSFLPILFSVAMWLLYNRVTVGTFIPLGSLHNLVGFTFFGGMWYATTALRVSHYLISITPLTFTSPNFCPSLHTCSLQGTVPLYSALSFLYFFYKQANAVCFLKFLS